MNASKFFLLASTLAVFSLSPLLAQNDWVNLFNGTNLDGWE